MVTDLDLRKTITFDSHYWFFHFYLSEYVKKPTPNFHREIYMLTEDFSQGHLVIPAFRGSSKSTILCLSYPLWAIMGKPGLKYVLIVGKTQEQAKLYLKHIIDELEKNEVLRSDLGPFKADDVWRSNAIVLTKYNAMIMCVSSEQAVRGFRHGSFRPQLIIADDLEDTQSVKTEESRDKLYDWLKNDLIPAREPGGRLVLSGAMLHQDSLVARLKKEIEVGTFTGIYRAYPVLDAQGRSMWPGLYPDAEAIEKLKKEIGDDAAWLQEFMLVPGLKGSAIIKPEDIHYYDYQDLPAIKDSKSQFRYGIIGVDVARSKRIGADRCAFVSALVFGYDDKVKIYILPNPINEQLEFDDQVKRLKLLSDQLVPGRRSKMSIESNGYQGVLAEVLANAKYPVEPVHVSDSKEDRLIGVSHYIKQGTVLFLSKGAESLIQQILGFGTEAHDDLVDATTLMISQVMAGDNAKKKGGIMLFENGKCVKDIEF